MARVKLEIPEKFIFSTTIDIRISDINYGGHLGNDSILSIIHEARVRFLKTNGFSEKDAGGAGIIMTDSVIVYLSEGFYGDKIKVDVAVDNITGTGCDIFYMLTNEDSKNEVAKAKTGIVFYDYEKKKVVRVTKKFIEKFG
jgi:acyl-CoA thioester hydrolase